MAAGSAMSTPENVVQAGFLGIDRGSSYIIDGRNNYMAAQLGRFLPRRRVALIMERMFSLTGLSAKNTKGVPFRCSL